MTGMHSLAQVCARSIQFVCSIDSEVATSSFIAVFTQLLFDQGLHGYCELCIILHIYIKEGIVPGYVFC
jgi:hypothetical protein